MTRETQVKWIELRIGILLLTAIGVLVVIIMNLEGGLGLFSGQTRFRAIVGHTQGLKIGGPVRMNGVDIGNVREIAIAEDSPKVEIVFSIKNAAARHVHTDATATIRPMGLLGDKFLEIEPGTASKPLLEPGGTVAGEAETDFTGLATGATATMDQLNHTIAEIRRFLAALTQGQGTAARLITDPTLYDRSKQLIEKLDTASQKGIAVLEKVERGEGTIGRLVADKELYNRANQAIQELTTLTTKLNKQDSTLAKLADPAFYKRLDGMAVRSEQLLARIERGEGTAGKLLARDELYARADKLLTEIHELVADVKKNPTKYFKITVF